MRRGKKDDCEQQELNGPPSGHLLEGLFFCRGPHGGHFLGPLGLFLGHKQGRQKVS